MQHLNIYQRPSLCLYISVLRFLNLLKKYMYSQYMMSFMIHSMKWHFFFFILTFYATMFSNIIIDLCHIHCFINNVIKNSKMLHLTSHRFKTIIFPDRWAGKCYHFDNQFLRLYAAQKTLMWVYFKCHKFNNSHFILTM